MLNSQGVCSKGGDAGQLKLAFIRMAGSFGRR